MEEYLVNLNKQIAVTAENQEDAFKRVLNGEGKVASTTMSANPRPKPAQPRAQMPMPK